MADDDAVAREAAGDTPMRGGQETAPPEISKLASEALPVGSLDAALPHLRRPFTPEAVRFKVQRVFREAKGCEIVAYIDARLVVERLNAVCGGEWSASYAAAPDPKHLFCHLSVFGVTRSDVGQTGKGFSKDLVSDALKRAAVHFGVGVPVYALPQITMWANGDDGGISRGLLEKREKRSADGVKDTLLLTDRGHDSLRASYRKNWLEPYGRRLFGLELDHGDQEGVTVDVEAEADAVEDFAPAPPAAVEDEDGKALIAACRAAYDEIAALGDGKGRELVPPVTFNGWLTGAQHSHGELRKLLEHLAGQRERVVAQLGGAS